MAEESCEDIIQFVKSCGYEKEFLCRNTTLGDDLGLYGDDLDNFLTDYSRRFDVDMSSYLWYYHTQEEGWNMGALFFRPPNKRVAHIPISIGMLKEYSISGHWSLKYPAHHVPERRIDLIINRVLVCCAFIMILVFLVKWLLVEVGP